MEKGQRYQFQPVCMIVGSDVLHDILICHHFCDGGKTAGIDTPKDAEELRDVWMRQ